MIVAHHQYVPALDANATPEWMVAAEQFAPVLSAHLLASLEDKTGQFQARNYCGDDFIERYRERTGHHIELAAALGV